MNCSEQKNTKKSVADSLNSDDSSINTACESYSNKVREPLWVRDRLVCTNISPQKTSFHQKSNFIAGQETKKQKFSRACKKNVNIKNMNKYLNLCDTTQDDPFKTGVCTIDSKKYKCKTHTNNLSDEILESVQNKEYSCIKYKKRIRHRQVCN